MNFSRLWPRTSKTMQTWVPLTPLILKSSRSWIIKKGYGHYFSNFSLPTFYRVLFSKTRMTFSSVLETASHIDQRSLICLEGKSAIFFWKGKNKNDMGGHTWTQRARKGSSSSLSRTCNKKLKKNIWNIILINSVWCVQGSSAVQHSFQITITAIRPKMLLWENLVCSTDETQLQIMLVCSNLVRVCSTP